MFVVKKIFISWSNIEHRDVKEVTEAFTLIQIVGVFLFRWGWR